MKTTFRVTYFLFVVLVIFSINAHAQINLNSGLVGYFPLDSNAMDESSIAINGVVGNAILTTGKNNNPDSAYYFNGVNANINCSANNRGVTNVVTVSVWLKTSSTANQFIVNKYDYSIDRGFHVAVFNGRPFIAGRNTGGVYFTTDLPNPPFLVNDGNWHHLVGEISENSWKFWVDCVPFNSVISNVSFPNISCSLPLTIGNYIMPTGVLTGYVTGTIDEVRIYNRTLTVAERALLCDVNYMDPVLSAPIVTNDTAVCDATVLSLYATSDTGTIYWESPLGTIIDSGNIHVDTITQDVIFYVYSVWNGNTSDTIGFRVDAIDCGCEFYIPNSFTPNGDGLNDYFLPISDCETHAFYFSIVDRWGIEVFSTENPNHGWDGTFKGQPVAIGVFSYILKYNYYTNGRQTPYEIIFGSVTVVK